jgi:large subunit ribosomal protein L1
MGRRSKRYREMVAKVEPLKVYPMADAIALLKGTPAVKFDQTVELSIRLGVDPRKNDQQVRGTVSLPNGTGQSLRVLVLARGEKVNEAIAAGADYAGYEEYVEKVSQGWLEFDAMVVTPDLMRDVSKLGKVLGPRGLMPTPKAGTVTTDVGRVVKELKAGKIEFKSDRSGVVNTRVGKLSFESNKLEENIQALLEALQKSKPASAKGDFLRSMTLSSTMGPGLRVDLRQYKGA